MTSLIIDGLAFKATEAIIEFTVVGDKTDFDALASSTSKDLPFTTHNGTMGNMVILDLNQRESCQWPGQSIIKIKAGLRLGN